MIADFSSKLMEHGGVYFSQTRSPISYPEGQNQACMQFEASSFWFQHRNDCIQAMIRNHPPQGAVLDIGGGNGFVSLAIKAAGFEPILLEPGEFGIRNAQSRGIDQLICSTFEDAELIDESIPAAGLFDVLEHISKDGAFLHNLRQKLKPGGRLYLTVPAFNFLWSQLDDHSGHFRRYTLSSLSECLKEAGFLVQYSTYIFSLLPLPIFLFRTVPSWLGLRRRPEQVISLSRKQHTRPDWVNCIWKREKRIIENRGAIPFGGSLLVAAVKA